MTDLLERLELKEKRIKELKNSINQKEKKKRLIELQKLAGKAGILELDSDVLLGAFLEISERAKDLKDVALWKKKAETKTTDFSPLILSFKTPPPPDVKESLKTLGFRWNSFRGEYYGSNDISVVKNLLKDLQHEVIKVDSSANQQ